MAPLPALQTVSSRQQAAAPVAAAGPADALPLPQPARQWLGELLRLELVTWGMVEAFLLRLGDRGGQLTSRDRAADASVGLKLVSRYAATRVIAGQGAALAFGNWRVVDRLSSGSVGVVFHARHATLCREAAIKVLPVTVETPRLVTERFWREVRVLTDLDHPHVVGVWDAGRVGTEADPEALYLTLELVPGGDLEEFVYANGPQPPEVVAAWGRDAAGALAACHAAGCVHRDVKPSNLFLDATRRVKLGDFGLARDFGSTQTDHKTLLGSLEFMAPEQLADSPTAGAAADVYGLAGTLFWALTGQTPYPKPESLQAAIHAIQSGPPRRLAGVSPESPAALDALFARMLAPAPGARPTAEQVARELAALAADAPPARPAESPHHRELSLTAPWQALAAGIRQSPVERDRSERVAALARVLAGALSHHPDWATFADPQALSAIEFAARLRDLGHGDESATHHAARGDEMLAELARSHAPVLPMLRLIRGVVRSHHERHDGSGSPDRLAGDRIPPAARVVAAAELYDHARDHGAHEDAIAQVESALGHQLDPSLAAVLPKISPTWKRLSAELRGEWMMLELAAEPEPPRKKSR